MAQKSSDEIHSKLFEEWLSTPRARSQLDDAAKNAVKEGLKTDAGQKAPGQAAGSATDASIPNGDDGNSEPIYYGPSADHPCVVLGRPRLPYGQSPTADAPPGFMWIKEVMNSHGWREVHPYSNLGRWRLTTDPRFWT